MADGCQIGRLHRPQRQTLRLRGDRVAHRRQPSKFDIEVDSHTYFSQLACAFLPLSLMSRVEAKLFTAIFGGTWSW